MSKMFGYVKSIIVEPYMFFMILSFIILEVPIDQLQQDKICLYQYNQTIDYCLKLSKLPTSDIKIAVLSANNSFNINATIINTITSIIWCLLIGSVCDRFPKSQKYFMIMTSVCAITMNIFLLFNTVYFDSFGMSILLVSKTIPCIFGSYWVGITLSFSFISNNSMEENRIIRFMVVDLIYAFALMVSHILGGRLLANSSWIYGSEIRNFSSIFIIGIICGIISVAWISFRIDNEKIGSEKNVSNHNVSKENVSDTNVSTSNNNSIEDKPEENSGLEKNVEIKKSSNWNYFRFIFLVLDPRNLVDSFKSIIVKRDPGLRKQLILMISSYIIIQMHQIGMYMILFEFTQRVYFWDFEMFSYVSAIGNITNPIMTLIVTYCLSKFLKLSDVEMCIVGALSMFISNIFIGSIPHPIGLFVGRLVFGSITGIATTSMRSKISKIIHSNESTKIFAAMTTIEVIVPSISILIYNNIFNGTMFYYPSLIVQISAACLLIPLCVFMFIDLKYERKFTLGRQHF